LEMRVWPALPSELVQTDQPALETAETSGTATAFAAVAG
jgi:hypothetical protein